MNFINDFNNIVKNPSVIGEVEELLLEGKKQSVFLNYFGVNYNSENLQSLKLYFSFFELPEDSFLKQFEISDDVIELIKNNWKTSTSYSYMHQGLTLGLKCYLENDKIKVAKYLHFRSEKLLIGEPSLIKLSNEDINNLPGICFENSFELNDAKKYYYVNTEEGKKVLIKKFNVNPAIRPEDIDIIEYTEWHNEQKINIINRNSDTLIEYFKVQNNTKILELNKYFFEKFKLYYFAPGIRFNSDTKALYYVTKESYYKPLALNTVAEIFNQKD